MTGFPVKLSNTPAALRRPPPTVGEHNDEIPEGLGLSLEEIRALQNEGVVGSENHKQANESDSSSEK